MKSLSPEVIKGAPWAKIGLVGVLLCQGKRMVLRQTAAGEGPAVEGRMLRISGFNRRALFLRSRPGWEKGREMSGYFTIPVKGLNNRNFSSSGGYKLSEKQGK
jgi:hypothetical protein